MEFLRYPQLIPAFFNIRVVRTSTASYRRFILSMDRSPGFGSTAHNFRPLQTRSRFGSGALRLNLAAHSNSPARSTKSTRSLSLPLLVNTGFQVLFHSPPGVLFTFPSRYYALSVHISVSPWRVVPPASHRVSRVPWYSGSCSMHLLTPTRLSLSLAELPSSFCFTHAFDSSPQPRIGFPFRFGLCPVRSPLLGVSLLIPFPPAT